MDKAAVDSPPTVFSPEIEINSKSLLLSPSLYLTIILPRLSMPSCRNRCSDKSGCEDLWSISESSSYSLTLCVCNQQLSSFVCWSKFVGTELHPVNSSGTATSTIQTSDKDTLWLDFAPQNEINQMTVNFELFLVWSNKHGHSSSSSSSSAMNLPLLFPTLLLLLLVPSKLIFTISRATFTNPGNRSVPSRRDRHKASRVAGSSILDM